MRWLDLVRQLTSTKLGNALFDANNQKSNGHADLDYSPTAHGSRVRVRCIHPD